MENQHFTDLDIVYLEDGTPVLEEVIYSYQQWLQRSPQERDRLTSMLHEYEIGEEWEEEDAFADIEFTQDEIEAFSKHILVKDDDGQPFRQIVPLSSSEEENVFQLVINHIVSK